MRRSYLSAKSAFTSEKRDESFKMINGNNLETNEFFGIEIDIKVINKSRYYKLKRMRSLTVLYDYRVQLCNS